ncbi:hypothetical protein [Phytohabitans rumicis]|uniref:Excalibur calcium-binding domain-containing protein n=1 Tax=Phytohabitans rumicis TaxID=1076125 RepID=A0A6V8L3U5_9ACTN|nr:hypothetical protein [Phytohabitans rumicis]GFJ89319.1 hypothetical protein Prum_029610 [Phytohabitans rumicis]
MSQGFRALADWLRARSRRERYGAAVLLLVVLLSVGAWAMTGGTGGAPIWSDGASLRDTGDGGGAAPDGDAGSGSDAGSGGKGNQAGSAVSAPPRVLDFAGQPGATPESPLPSPTAPLEIEEGNEGCDYSYGDRTVCVPWEFPEGVTDKCAWLKERGYKPLQVNGRDRHGLDRNGDGIGCGDGD